MSSDRVRAKRPIQQQQRPSSSGDSILKKRKVDMNIIINNALQVSQLPLSDSKIDLNDYNQVQIRVQQYLEIIKKHGMQPTIVGLASAMGLDRNKLYEVHAGTRPVKDARVKELIDQMYAVTLMVLEDGMQAGLIKEVTGIFLLKNNYGYKDQQEYVVTGGNLLGDAKSDIELLEEYRSSVPMLDEFEE